MTFGGILLLAIGLAMDAMAVAAAKGLATPRIRTRHVLLVAVFFGGFQAFMPFLGWLAGSRLGPLIEAWDHWVAFLLLGAIGAKMLADARNPAPAEAKAERDPFALDAMLVLAVATSIDALAAGITLPMLGAPLGLSLATIGVTTGILSGIGLFAGRRFGTALGRRLDAFGGVVLIALGLKIVVQHLRAG